VSIRGPRRGFFIADIQNRDASAEDDLHQELEALSLSTDERKTGFRAYSRADAVAAAEKALALHFADNQGPGTVLKFIVSAGQELFVQRYGAGPVSDLVITSGKICKETLWSQEVKPYFNSFPLATFKNPLVRQLDGLGYQLMTMDDRPKSYTMIHLQASPEEMFARLLFKIIERNKIPGYKNSTRVSGSIRIGH
jgi:hypothetical protein